MRTEPRNRVLFKCLGRGNKITIFCEWAYGFVVSYHTFQWNLGYLGQRYTKYNGS